MICVNLDKLVEVTEDGDPQQLEDARRIFKLMAKNNHCLDLEACYLLWHEWCQDQAAEWLKLPVNDDELFVKLITKAQQLAYHLDGFVL